ncbi:actinorhodin polyketide synthase acyl carrier protein [Streptomyces sp. NBRC 14336]|uniref:acyl carrier protein n=1 Tax=Streptomyces sp. NBRC 14336 TaxID=3030992 RepID=UPI0024A515AA|nr:acyl carrier protein [Streptomyces sp. NBRC 14336]WBO80936.1 acyl carrier protein [Streptomyces sp. SBE_14.2]GLW48197.1 actinorhodin polyketide synthase acyl carrier protein [Streptomyces sp. NBRC 14336]
MTLSENPSSGFTLADLLRLLSESAGVPEGIDLEADDVVDTPFYRLGYDSLALLQVTGRLKREYGLLLPDTIVADAPTPRALLTVIAHARAA